MGRRVVLVHGLWYGPLSLRVLDRRLTGLGLECHQFRYRTLSQKVASASASLHAFARELGGQQLDFVGHSLGGLVVLHMLDRYADLPAGRVVLLGAPARGSAVASRMLELKPTRPLIGAAATAFEHGYNRAPASHQTGVIAGTSGIGLGRLIKPLSKPHDGTIQATETRLENSEMLELPVSHTGLVINGRVAEAVATFLNTGRFNAASQAPS
ncbi:MAG: alpha/beta fold hydrolase [Wenzhouxiangella sp.]